MADKIVVLIDGGYITKLLQDFSLRIDFGRFVNEIVKPDELLRTYYYDCLPYQSRQPTPDESDRLKRVQRFHDALNRIPRFEVRRGYVKFQGVDQISRKPIYQQKGVDVLLVVDLLRLSFNRSISRAYLIGGDGDYVPAIQVAKDLGVSVYLFYGNTPNSKYAQPLWEMCDERKEITNNMLTPFKM